MRVLVTGHRGYIGVHLVDLLKQAGHEVTGVDLALFDACEWEPYVLPDRELLMDFRDVGMHDLEGFDCVMHLAAISNDPMGDLAPELTYSINRDGSIRLAQVAKAAGVSRFLFAGSCSIYGQGRSLEVDEMDELNPLSTYAESKVQAEQAIRALADDEFSPVFLRNATAYGHSPMLRIDLVANNLLACAYACGEIRIMSDGTPWRPLIHCRDIARAFVAALESRRERIHNVAVNVGADGENYQVKDIADHVRRLVPSADIEFTGEIGVDPRSYRVSFELLSRVLPDFTIEYTLERGLAELHAKLVEHHFGLSDWEGPRFVRLRTLRARMNAWPAIA